jgi:hypothetical protein
MELDLKIFRMDRLGAPQERIAKRLYAPQRTVSNHLAKMPGLAKPLNADLSRGFTVPQGTLYSFTISIFSNLAAIAVI